MKRCLLAYLVIINVLKSPLLEGKLKRTLAQSACSCLCLGEFRCICPWNSQCSTGKGGGGQSSPPLVG